MDDTVEYTLDESRLLAELGFFRRLARRPAA